MNDDTILNNRMNTLMTEMLEIEKALDKNDNRVGRFIEPNYTLGWIRASVNRALKKDE